MSDYSGTGALDLVNLSGFAFQHGCASRIAALPGFQVAQEVPFTFPGSNGPLLGVHGTIDIVATHRANPESDDIVCLVTEVKRARTEIKKWLFFENEQKNPKWPLFAYEDNLGDSRNVMLTRMLTFPSLGYATQAAYQYCSNALEVNSKFTSINQNQTEKVYQSLKQAAHATRALLQMPKVIEGLGDLGKSTYRHLIFLPVVVTTAELYIPTFNRQSLVGGDVDIKDFELGEPKQWVTYDFPLPDYIGYRVPRSEDTTLTAEKLTVFVVSANHLESFFEMSDEAYTLEGIPQPYKY